MISPTFHRTIPGRFAKLRRGQILPLSIAIGTTGTPSAR
jgi:hypothetical protein